MTKKYSDDELLALERTGRQRGQSLIEIAITNKISPQNFDGRLKLIRKRRMKDLFSIDFGTPWELSGDWMIVGDVHVPSTNVEFAKLPAMVAAKHMTAPRRLLIGGDFFNMDTFSSYVQVVQSPSWAQEREAAKELLHLWLETFDEIRLIMGNHDRRLQKWTAGAFESTDILAMVISNPDKVMMSNYGWCTIKSGGVDWRVKHPKEYSINQLTVAEQHALKYQTNTISFHEHHLSMGFDKWANYVIVNGGSLADHNKIAYMVLDDTKKPVSKLGFVMLKGGTPYLFGPSPFTDWSMWI